MAWWRRKKEPLEKHAAADKVSVPKGVWSKCESCGEITYTDELVANLRVCPVCGHHAPMPTRERIAAMIDEGTWQETDAHLKSGDPLGFVDQKPYPERLEKAVRQSGANEAFIAGFGDIDGVPASVGFFAFEFMGGSMGSVVGEKVTLVFEHALEKKRPAIVFSASGGARMQEGVLSLMQMAKTSAARGRLREAGLPYISVVLHPTTGGVAASFAMLGDLIIAEPRALVGFAGPRVIQQTIGQELPKGFQRAEFLLEHGMVDRIVPRLELREQLGLMLRLLAQPHRGPDRQPDAHPDRQPDAPPQTGSARDRTHPAS
jgi:acetyl-CoA carboxylase carboxyl transferase subunit beta